MTELWIARDANGMAWVCHNEPNNYMNGYWDLGQKISGDVSFAGNEIWNGHLMRGQKRILLLVEPSTVPNADAMSAAVTATDYANLLS